MYIQPYHIGWLSSGTKTFFYVCDWNNIFNRTDVAYILHKSSLLITVQYSRIISRTKSVDWPQGQKHSYTLAIEIPYLTEPILLKFFMQLDCRWEFNFHAYSAVVHHDPLVNAIFNFSFKSYWTLDLKTFYLNFFSLYFLFA